MANLIESLLKEMNRVRELIKQYEDPLLQGAGAIAATMMKLSIERAEKAIASGDVIEELKCYEDLKKYEA